VNNIEIDNTDTTDTDNVDLSNYGITNTTNTNNINNTEITDTLDNIDNSSEDEEEIHFNKPQLRTLPSLTTIEIPNQSVEPSSILKYEEYKPDSPVIKEKPITPPPGLFIKPPGLSRGELRTSDSIVTATNNTAYVIPARRNNTFY